MSSLKKELIIIGILFAWAITASMVAMIYYSEYNYMYQKYVEERSTTIVVDIGINYGNGTLVWYNNTKLLKGMSVYDALLIVADTVNSTTSPFGVYVRGINGVNENANDSWIYAINRNDSDVNAWFAINGWYYPGASCDRLALKEGDSVVWLFYNWRAYFPPPDPTTNNNVR